MRQKRVTYGIFRSLPKFLGLRTELGSPSLLTLENVFVSNEAAVEAVCSLLCNNLDLCILALFSKGHILHSILWCSMQVFASVSRLLFEFWNNKINFIIKS